MKNRLFTKLLILLGFGASAASCEASEYSPPEVYYKVKFKVEGKVTDESGKAIAGIGVAVKYPSLHTSLEEYMLTDKDGNYSSTYEDYYPSWVNFNILEIEAQDIDGELNGGYFRPLYHRALLNCVKNAQFEYLAEKKVDLVLELEPEPEPEPVGTYTSFKGKVTDIAGQPIKDIQLTISIQNGDRLDNRSFARTDENGEYSTRMYVPEIDGTFVVRVEDKDGIYNGGKFATAEQTVEIKKDDEADDQVKTVNFTLEMEEAAPYPELELSGKVTDMESEPIEGILIRVIYNRGNGWHTWKEIFTDENGNYIAKGGISWINGEFVVVAEDIDGELNGGKFISSEQTFVAERDISDVDTWNERTAERTVDFMLELKRPEPEE